MCHRDDHAMAFVHSINQSVWESGNSIMVNVAVSRLARPSTVRAGNLVRSANIFVEKLYSKTRTLALVIIERLLKFTLGFVEDPNDHAERF
jgi:hypothetical protein